MCCCNPLTSKTQCITTEQLVMPRPWAWSWSSGCSSPCSAVSAFNYSPYLATIISYLKWITTGKYLEKPFTRSLDTYIHNSILLSGHSTNYWWLLYRLSYRKCSNHFLLVIECIKTGKWKILAIYYREKLPIMMYELVTVLTFILLCSFTTGMSIICSITFKNSSTF